MIVADEIISWKSEPIGELRGKNPDTFLRCDLGWWRMHIMHNFVKKPAKIGQNTKISIIW